MLDQREKEEIIDEGFRLPNGNVIVSKQEMTDKGTKQNTDNKIPFTNTVRFTKT